MRIRTIKPEFWLHEGLCALPEFTRLLAIALLNWADDEGYFMANPAILRGSLFPFLDDSKKIPRGLQELSSVGWIDIGKDSQGRDVGRIRNFAKHQRVDKPRASEIKASSAFQEASKNVLGGLQDDSREEWNGMEQGKGSGNGNGKPEREHSAPSAWNPSPEQIEVASWFSRKPTTEWSKKEKSAWLPIDTLFDFTSDEWKALRFYYRSGCKYCHQDLQTLLNNWNGEIDRAKKYDPDSK